MHCNWVVELGGRMSVIEVGGDIGLRRPRPTHGCRADDDGPHRWHGRFGQEKLFPQPGFEPWISLACSGSRCRAAL
jgi:hypothetical protein